MDNKENKNYFTFAKKGEEPLRLESGAELTDVTIAYERWGQLNEEKDNVILLLHAFSGDSHAASHSKEDAAGWWEFLFHPYPSDSDTEESAIGLDSGKYFILCPNILGSCSGSTGPSSINPATNSPYGLDFPMMTIGDIVETQKRLLDSLGITKIQAVIGGSVGGMQVLEWCARYPQMVAAAVPIATTMRHSALAIAFNEIARQAIMADPHWTGEAENGENLHKKGDYYAGKPPATGLAVARMVGHVTYLSDSAMRRKFGRRLQDKERVSYGFDADFQVESYLRHQGSKFVERFDANSLLYITKAADYFNAAERLSAVRPLENPANMIKYLVISYNSDWLYPTYQGREIVHTLKRAGQDVSFVEIDSDCGHDAFLIPERILPRLLAGFLDGITENENKTEIETKK